MRPESEAVPGRKQESAARQCLQGPASIAGYGVRAFEFGLVEMLKSVPEIGKYLVAWGRVLTAFFCQPPRPSLNLVGCPDQRLLFGPLFTGTPGKVKFIRTPVLHPLIGAAEGMGLLPDLADTFYLAHYRFSPHLHKGPTGLLRIFHSATV